MSPIKFSIITVAYNATYTIRHTIQSVLDQTYTNFEIIILENGGTEEARKYIKDNIELLDERISVIYIDKNIGWPKGTSVCLEVARGEYMIMLAADDFFVSKDSLRYVSDEIDKNNPDIVFVGNNFALYDMDSDTYSLTNKIVPPYRNWNNTDRIDSLVCVMYSTYYNSMFHFEKISFLKDNGIDFYLPYYADCESMTEAICMADNISIIDKEIYTLTSNTSQTSGSICIRNLFKYQWKSVEQCIEKYGIFDWNKLAIIASRILKHFYGTTMEILNGIKLRNTEMQPIIMNEKERIMLAYEFISCPEIVTMEIISLPVQLGFVEDFCDQNNTKKLFDSVVTSINSQSFEDAVKLDTDITHNDIFDFICHYLYIALSIKNTSQRTDYVGIIDMCLNLFDSIEKSLSEEQLGIIKSLLKDFC